ncbi:PCP degradation transcriptional activation protein [compost metagenome]|uniref:DNA-binding transcriptional regulator, LysR family n=3 Tax=Pseudomonas TaxID=286 RepID=A0A1H4N319_PSEJE|nr:DNA-binding transcriptional regulator, LysR family [Pseudomonas jessenii]VVP79402.1 PCP degradation transcriptional activation protein [Pseudomonas fluorescens]
MEWMLNSNSLRKLDMQDLMVFVAVHEQNSVTDVSETLCVSQSTVSYCLKKLRTSFEDELFINTRTGGMQPTGKASAMYPHVLKILESINLCHAGLPTFDPGLQPVTFNICAPEYFEQLILPRLLKTFDLADLPVMVNVFKLQADIPAQALREGSLDLVMCFGPNFHRSHVDFKSQTLLEDDLVCVFDKRATPAVPRLSLQTYVERRHVFPTPWTSATNMVDGWLAQQAQQRHIVARANSYSAALKLITGTDYVLTLPRRIQRLLANADTFNHCEAPAGLPGFTLDMQWNQAVDQDSANTWLRAQVIQACFEQETA